MRYARSWCRPIRLTETVRILLFWGAVSWSYNWLKTFIPITNPVTYDLLLDRVDTALHFGVNPNRFVLAFFPFPAWWRFVDFSYGLLHAERLTKMLVDVEIGHILLKQAAKFPERRVYAERHIRRMLPRVRHMSEEIRGGDTSVFEWLAERAAWSVPGVRTVEDRIMIA